MEIEAETNVEIGTGYNLASAIIAAFSLAETTQVIEKFRSFPTQ